MEKEILTPGQKAVIDGYLLQYEPTETYDEETCTLFDTATIINELSSMCEFEQNHLADYLASLGYRFYIITDEDSLLVGIFGWILKKKQPSNPQ